MNFLEGRSDAGTRQFVTGTLALGLSETNLIRIGARERVTLGLRPEHIRLAHSQREASLPATVYVTELMGNETLVFLRLGPDQKIIARAGADFRAEQETPVWVSFDMERAEFFDAESGEALR
jgi:ABC-type sugar transport system ATPase subunit